MLLVDIIAYHNVHITITVLYINPWLSIRETASARYWKESSASKAQGESVVNMLIVVEHFTRRRTHCVENSASYYS